MAKNFIQTGDVLDYTPSADTTAGTPVLLGGRLGVVLADIKANATGPIRMCGVWSITKVTADVVAQWALLYWDNTAKKLTVTSSGNTLVGYATAAAGNGATTVNIKLYE